MRRVVVTMAVIVMAMRGMRVVVMVPPSLEFYTLTFALFKLGAVVVLIDPGMGVRNLGKCLAEAQPEAFVGVAKAHLARVLLGWPQVAQQQRSSKASMSRPGSTSSTRWTRSISSCLPTR